MTKLLGQGWIFKMQYDDTEGSEQPKCVDGVVSILFWFTVIEGFISMDLIYIAFARSAI